MATRLNRDTFGARSGDRSARDYPEKVLQFGTGGFLRAFSAYFVQRANERGQFRGRILMVASTGTDRTQRLAEQDGLYTLAIRGREAGEIVDRYEIISSVSRALSSNDQWDEVLAAARNPHLELVISNTTEVGIVLDPEEDLGRSPPTSFPGKLTALLHERFATFGPDPSKGLIVLPCELVESNGELLRDIVLELARRHALGDSFIEWVSDASVFCNTLVDRIVPGRPRDADAFLPRLGYYDELLTVAEPYRLWAIEGDAAFAERFPLSGADAGIVVAPDIEPYRERKVRILNGTHTAIVPAAILTGFETVLDAMEDPSFRPFVEQIAFREIVPSLDSDAASAARFASEVLERFSNPFIRHELLDITFQQTRKMRVRIVPTLAAYFRRFGHAPPAITLGFACFILYQHPEYRPAHRVAPTDDALPLWEDAWRDRSIDRESDVRAMVSQVLADESVWGYRLDRIDGLTDLVASNLVTLRKEGVRAAMTAHIARLSSQG